MSCELCLKLECTWSTITSSCSTSDPLNCIFVYAILTITAGSLNDVSIPMIGLGTYKFKKGSGQAEKTVTDALNLGYRMIDTAFIYAGETTEMEVGKALQTVLSSSPSSTSTSSISRSDIFITTKQWRAYHGYDSTLKCLDLSLKRLQLDYVDLYLIHWPGKFDQKHHN